MPAAEHSACRQSLAHSDPVSDSCRQAFAPCTQSRGQVYAFASFSSVTRGPTDPTPVSPLTCRRSLKQQPVTLPRMCSSCAASTGSAESVAAAAAAAVGKDAAVLTSVKSPWQSAGDPESVPMETLSPGSSVDAGGVRDASPTLRDTPERRRIVSYVRNKHWVFVYGTLKRGFANHTLLASATYIGDFRTSTPYPLVVGGAFFSPYLLDMPNTGARVLGEVYAVCDEALAALDTLENVGVNYTRRPLSVVSAADRSFHVSAYTYLKCNFGEELLRKPTMDNYVCRKYVPRHRRPRPCMPVGDVSVCTASFGTQWAASSPRGRSDTGLLSASCSQGSCISNLSSEGAQRGVEAVGEGGPSIPALVDHPGVSLYAGSAASFHVSGGRP